MKYEMIFGDESLFDSLIVPDYVEVIRINDYSKEYLWGDLNTVKLLTSKELKAIPIVAMRRIIKTPVQHSDDIAVDLFAAKMKEKLAKSRDKGRGGWEDCPIEYLIASLKDHILKGDPVDVANFSMMISLRGESIKTPVWTVADQKAGQLPEVGTKAVQCQEYCIVDILNVRNGYIVVCNSEIDDSRPTTFEIKRFLELFKPIETPAEKAQREEDEFVVAMLDAASQEQLMSAGFKSGVIAAYRKLKGGE